MKGKRPHDTSGEGSEAKRVRSNQGSPIAVQANGASDAERKKAEAAARIAAIKAKMAASKANGASAAAPLAPPSPTPPPPQPAAEASNAEAKRAEGQRKIAEFKAKMAASKTNGSAIQPAVAAGAAPSPTPPPPTSGSEVDGIEAKRAEAQRRIAAFKAKMAAQRGGVAASPVNGAAATPPPPQDADDRMRISEASARAAALAARRHGAASPAVPAPALTRPDKPSGRTGLAIGLHPSLLSDIVAPAGTSKAGQKGSKFSTAKGNQPQPVGNPYLSAEQPVKVDGAPRAGERKSRQFVFNEKGKYMAQAKRLRDQAELEEMKRKWAAEARKVEIEEAGDKAFLVPAPPKVEWWDEGLLPEGQASYDNHEAPGRNRIDTPDSIITILIQHPVILAAPQDKFIPAPKPLMLTQTEQKKIRRQRRMADMKEEQAKIRLGLMEPPPPKVKKSNMMRVLGEQAVKDPTAVEARVNREIAERAENHEKDNADRQLTKEQRVAKLAAQQALDEAKGVRVAVFRVDDLSSGKHRYQVDITAKQNALTGIVILNPTMNLIVVEGGSHSIAAYKKLLTSRIRWTENAAPAQSANSESAAPAPRASTFVQTTDGSNADAVAGTRGTGSKAAVWCSAYGEDGQLKDLSNNRCVLVWEGEAVGRVFKRWGSRACETDGEAREVLRRTKMENMWTLGRGK